MMSAREVSELILNKDGSIFHLHLLPHQIAENIILVGDPNRVKKISSYFSKIEHQVENREFITHTGIFNHKRISAISTGIGTDNIDIVINEIDALFNIDLLTGKIKNKKTSLNFIRLGTCGGLQPNLAVNSFLLSQYVLGLDNLLYYYKDLPLVQDNKLINHFISTSQYKIPNVTPYALKSSDDLTQQFASKTQAGITLTAPGFYAPQGRQLRLAIAYSNQNEELSKYRYNNVAISNFEMESSALYGLSKLLGHNAVTICVVIANRLRKEFSDDYNIPMKKLIEKILNEI